MWAGTKDWVYKHRHKLGGAAVVAGVVGVMWYMPEHNPLSASFGQPTATAAGARGQRQAQAEGVEAGDAGEDEDWPTAVSSSPADLSSTSSRSASAAQRASTQRSRILLRVRKEFSTQALQFLPLLQSKVLRAVDFDHACIGAIGPVPITLAALSLVAAILSSHIDHANLAVETLTLIRVSARSKERVHIFLLGRHVNYVMLTFLDVLNANLDALVLPERHL